MHCSLAGYSGSDGAIAPPQGFVDVSASLGTAGHLKLFYNLIVTEPGATGGVHIHSGTSCATVCWFRQSVPLIASDPECVLFCFECEQNCVSIAL